MRATRVWRRRTSTALAAARLPVGLGVQGAQATGRTVTKKALAPRVVYEQISDSSYPIWEYALLYDGGAAKATIDQVLSAHQIGTPQRTSVISANAAAIAGVDGDLTVWPARPTHQYVLDGMPVQSPTSSTTV
jgi:hypothetical protein